MEGDLKSLRIDRGRKQRTEPSSWAKWWIIGGVFLFLFAGLGNFIYGKWNAAVPVDLYRVELPQAGGSAVAGTQNVILNATGYIVAHHKIQVASKVLAKLRGSAWTKGISSKKGR